MITTEDLNEVMNSVPKVPCNGVFYRYLRNNYVDRKGAIHMAVSMKKLKNLSCKGCSDCNILIDNIEEDVDADRIEFAAGLMHGDVVTLRIIDDSIDTETGLVDGWHVRVYKYVKHVIG